MRLTLAVILGSVLLAMACACSSADVGARPLGMGGAFVGLADDANAAYYNPAGIARLTSPQATVMYDARDSEGVVSESYLSYVSRIPGRDIGYGVSFVSDREWAQFYEARYDGHMNSYCLSGASKLNDTYVGMNVRYADHPGIPILRSDPGIDLSFLQMVNDKLSVGVLLQNINSPRLTFTDPQGLHMDVSFAFPMIVRPGIAYRADKDTVVTMDLYDMTSRFGGSSLRLGAEKVLKSTLALRAGYYSLGELDSLTFGAGGKIGKMQFDAAVLTGDLDNAVVLSAGSKY